MSCNGYSHGHVSLLPVSEEGCRGLAPLDSALQVLPELIQQENSSLQTHSLPPLPPFQTLLCLHRRQICRVVLGSNMLKATRSIAEAASWLGL